MAIDFRPPRFRLRAPLPPFVANPSLFGFSEYMWYTHVTFTI